MPLEKSFLSARPASIAASSWLYRDGGFEVRLHDTLGRGGPVEVSLPIHAETCEAVDFNGRPMDFPKVRLQGDRVSFEMGAWEIVTLRFTAAS